MAGPDIKDIDRRMDGAVDVLRKELGGLRTGRAAPSLLEPIQVDAYGSKMPLNQIGNVTVPEPRMLAVQVWDNSLVKAAERAIRNSGLGLNPITEGQTIRVPLPELSEERRRELAKVAGKYAEQTRVAIRNVRRDGMETLKRLERDSEISQDEQKKFADEIQVMTDRHVKAVDELLAQKEGEIMQV